MAVNRVTTRKHSSRMRIARLETVRASVSVGGGGASTNYLAKNCTVLIILLSI